MYFKLFYLNIVVICLLNENKAYSSLSVSSKLYQIWEQFEPGATFGLNTNVLQVLEDIVSSPVAPSIVLDCLSNGSIWLNNIISIHMSSSDELSSYVCNNSENMKDILTRHNTKKQQYFIIVADAQTCRMILQIANTLDLILGQQGFYLDIYNWVFLTYENCHEFIADIESINHVVCVELQSSNIYSPIWIQRNNQTRLWNKIATTSRAIQENITYFPNSRDHFNGRHLRIGCQVWPGYFSADVINNVTVYSGMYERLIKYISERLNFTYDIVIPLDGTWGSRKEDGTWSGLIGDILNNRTDFVIAPLTKNWMRMQAVDSATFFFQSVSTSLVYRTPEPEGRALLMLSKPFRSQVWTAVLICIVLYSLSALVIYALYRKSIYNKEQLSKLNCINKGLFLAKGYIVTFEKAFNSLITQAIALPLDTSSRYVWGGWFLFGVIMASLWSSAVISFLTVTVIPIPFTTVNDVGNQNSHTVGVLGGGSMADLLINANNSQQRAIWRQIKSAHKHDKDVLSTDFSVHVEKVLTDNYVYMSDDISVRFIKEASKCDLYMIPFDGIPIEHYTVAMPKNSAYKDRLNKVVLALTESGIANHLLKQYILSHETCGFQHSEYGAKMLTLSNFEHLFYALGGAVGVCFVIFVFEIIFGIIKVTV